MKYLKPFALTFFTILSLSAFCAELIDLGIPGGEASAISADGTVVVGTGGGGPFRWTVADGVIELGFKGIAHGVSDDGTTIVGEVNTGRYPKGFRWTSDGGLALLGDLGGLNPITKAYDVSADGSVIVGDSSSPTQRREAFRWTISQGIVGLGALTPPPVASFAHGVSADGTVIVGYGAEAYRWTSDSGMVGLGGLPGGLLRSRAFGISADGSVVVGSAKTDGTFPWRLTTEAFRWTRDSGMVGLGQPSDDGRFSSANAISADGWVVVGRSIPEGAFVWDPFNGMRSLESILISQGITDFLGLTLLEAHDISADGTVIVGRGSKDHASAAFVARIDPFTATPMLIDIKPGSEPNSVNLKSGQNISVAVLTTNTLDALEILYALEANPESIAFGPGRATEIHSRGHVKDVDNDGDMDLLLHFDTEETAIECGDTEATLVAESLSRVQLFGTDSILTAQCPKPAYLDWNVEVAPCGIYGGYCVVGINNLDLGGVLYDVTWVYDSFVNVLSSHPGVATFVSDSAKANDAARAMNQAFTAYGEYLSLPAFEDQNSQNYAVGVAQEFDGVTVEFLGAPTDAFGVIGPFLRSASGYEYPWAVFTRSPPKNPEK